MNNLIEVRSNNCDSFCQAQAVTQTVSWLLNSVFVVSLTPIAVMFALKFLSSLLDSSLDDRKVFQDKVTHADKLDCAISSGLAYIVLSKLKSGECILDLEERSILGILEDSEYIADVSFTTAIVREDPIILEGDGLISRNAYLTKMEFKVTANITDLGYAFMETYQLENLE